MFKSILLSLFVSLLACDLISEKGGHALLLKLEKELMNYNAKIKQEKITYAKEKKQTLASKPNNQQTPILSQQTTKYLDKQINESDKLKEKCNDIIQTTLKKIQEMDVLYNKALILEKEANEIKATSDRARSKSDWSTQKKITVDQLSTQAQNNISSAKHWPQETKRIYQSLKDSIETTINNAINHTYHLEQDIRTGQIPEDWINRILDNNQSANEIIAKYEKTLKEYTTQESNNNANHYVKELEEKVKKALDVIKSSY